MDSIPIQLPILLDGGLSEELRQNGCDENITSAASFAISHPELLCEIQERYVTAGAKIISTATHGANSAQLKKYSLEKNADEICRDVCRITYDMFHGRALIAGKISSTGMDTEPYGEYTFTEIMSIYRNQVKAMSPYCDMFVIESVPMLSNMRAAALACKKEHKPFIIMIKVDSDGETAVGADMLSTLIVMQELGVAAFGVNCKEPEICAKLLKELYPYSKIPLIAKPSAFLPDGSIISPEDFAEQCRACLDSGAQLIGGCCGTTGEHIKALSDMLSTYSPSVNEEKCDTSLIFATEEQIFFLQPDTTEFSPEIRCSGDISDELTSYCSESYDVLTIAINSPDDAICFADNMHMASLPVSFLSDDEISLKMALMLYQGRAMVDSRSLIPREKLEEIALKYGAVLY